LPDSQVQWSDKHPSVIAYSVFDKTGHVTWLLTIDEMLNVYDLELLVQSKLKQFWKYNSL
jgi:hypothetical protein